MHAGPLLAAAAPLSANPQPFLRRFPIDYENSNNAGLVPLIKALNDYKRETPYKITWADLATLGGAVAAEAAGGELS